MKTEIQLDKDIYTEDSELNENWNSTRQKNFTEDSELNENWHSTRQRDFYRRLRIKWKLKFNLTNTILRKTQN